MGSRLRPHAAATGAAPSARFSARFSAAPGCASSSFGSCGADTNTPKTPFTGSPNGQRQMTTLAQNPFESHSSQ
eukprot:jgi/Hompol1/6368/HPOL_004957-RA